MKKNMDGSLPFVSVVVVTRNRAASLRRTLEALQELDYPSYEIMVVDHSSEDETGSIAEELGARRVVAPLAYGISRCRQLGVDSARGEVIAMCDDDCVPVKTWLQHLTHRLLTDPAIGLLGGRVINIGFPEAKRSKGRTKMVGPNGLITFAATPEEAEFFGNANLAFRREDFQAVGGYDPFFHTSEEIDLALRFRNHGYRVAFEPAAAVEHHFTRISHKRDRFFFDSQTMRLYLYLKHFTPQGWAEWKRFSIDEGVLLLKDLYRLSRGFGSAFLRRRFNRLRPLSLDLLNTLTARLAIPWLLRRARANQP